MLFLCSGKSLPSFCLGACNIDRHGEEVRARKGELRLTCCFRCLVWVSSSLPKIVSPSSSVRV